MVFMGGEIGNSRQVSLGIALIGGVSWLFERLFFRQIEKRYEVWRSIDRVFSVPSRSGL